MTDNTQYIAMTYEDLSFMLMALAMFDDVLKSTTEHGITKDTIEWRNRIKELHNRLALHKASWSE